MIELKQTETFRKWRIRLRDDRARAMIATRLNRLAHGNVGDAEPVGGGVSELRIHYDLLCGGDKSTQAKDIETAKRLAREWSD